MPGQYQFRCLFWGMFGALVLRASFIFAGVALLDRFEALLFVFGAFLVFTRCGCSLATRAPPTPPRAARCAWCSASCPSPTSYDGSAACSRAVGGRRVATPLFAVLVMVENRRGVRRRLDPGDPRGDPQQFIVFSSNAFAIVGLRALYFCLSGMPGPVPLPRRRDSAPCSPSWA